MLPGATFGNFYDCNDLSIYWFPAIFSTASCGACMLFWCGYGVVKKGWPQGLGMMRNEMFGFETLAI